MKQANTLLFAITSGEKRCNRWSSTVGSCAANEGMEWDAFFVTRFALHYESAPHAFDGFLCK